MSLALPVVPLISAAILAICLPIRRIRVNVARLALVSWLLGCNIAQGINAIVWFSNEDLKAFPWCDIVTKLVLATYIAIPGACLCISRNLGIISSSRDLSAAPKLLRNDRIFEAAFCYLIPLCYMPFHVIGQDYRFDILKGVGCVASIHFSTPASLAVWLPPIIICILSFIYSGLAIHNSFRLTATSFSIHLESRSTMNSSLWTRTLTISLATTSIIFLVIIFSVFSLPMSDFWGSWSHVHEHLGEVFVVTGGSQAGGIKTVWWGLRVVTLSYIVLVILLGEETRDIWKYLGGLKIKKPNLNFKPLTILCRKKDDSVVIMTRQTRPVTLELRSGWDDDLDIKKTKSSKSSNKSVKTGSPSPRPSTADETFFQSTIPYLGSSFGDSMGFNCPILPSPVYKSPTRKNKPYINSNVIYETPRSPTYSLASPTTPSQPLLPKKTHRAQMESRTSNIISSVLEEHWPLPPLTSPSPVPSNTTTYRDVSLNSPTRASSPELSVTVEDRRQACTYFPSASPPQFRPFQPGPSIRPLSPPLNTTRVERKQFFTRPSLRSLRGSWSKERVAERGNGNEVILMTVVQETI